MDGITEAELAPYIDAVAASVASRGPFKALVTISLKVGPTAPQRKMIADAESRIHFKRIEKIALVSQSALVRGAMTAIAWVFSGKQQIRAYSPASAYEVPTSLSDLGDEALICAAMRETALQAGYTAGVLTLEDPRLQKRAL